MQSFRDASQVAESHPAAVSYFQSVLACCQLTRKFISGREHEERILTRTAARQLGHGLEGRGSLGYNAQTVTSADSVATTAWFARSCFTGTSRGMSSSSLG